jgi:indole-3-glycerol phosphate synthase
MNELVFAPEGYEVTFSRTSRAAAHRPPARSPARISANLSLPSVRLARKLEAVAQRERRRPLGALGEAARPTSRSLRRALAHHRPLTIAECNDPWRARTSTAAAMSVVTDEQRIPGGFETLRSIREIVEVPIVSDDLVVSTYQIVEARVFGADAVRLPLVVLDDASVRACLRTAALLGMDGLVEVRDDLELRRALELPAPIIAINDRAFGASHGDLAVAERLVSAVPADRFVIMASRVESPADARRLLGRVHGFIGEPPVAASLTDRRHRRSG